MGAKVGSSLLSPTAFALTISLAGTYEDAGAGVQASNLADITTSYSMSIGEKKRAHFQSSPSYFFPLFTHYRPQFYVS